MNDGAVIFDMVLPFCLLGGTINIVHAKTQFDHWNETSQLQLMKI